MKLPISGHTMLPSIFYRFWANVTGCMAGENKTWVVTTALALGAIILGCGAVFGALQLARHSGQASAPAGVPQSPTQATEVINIAETAPNWWESSRQIYFDIPARILIKLPGADENKARRVIGQAWLEFDRMGRIFNPYDPETEVAAINRSPSTEWTDISNALYEIVQISKKLWTAADGCFDPTFLPVKRLWQEAEKTQKFPSGRQIQKTLQSTGFEKVTLRPDNGGQIRLKNPAVKFDFGGIAKGYALDQVRQYLKHNGVADGLLQLGGEIAAFGEKNAAGWRIGIQHPRNMAKIWGIISSKTDIRVSTSGNYRQPIVIQGQSVYHIFSPKTGQPVSVKVLGVTTVSFDGAHSNALLDGAATAITVLGPAEGIELADKLGIEALILTGGSHEAIKETMTRGFPDLYERREEAR